MVTWVAPASEPVASRKSPRVRLMVPELVPRAPLLRSSGKVRVLEFVGHWLGMRVRVAMIGYVLEPEASPAGSVHDGVESWVGVVVVFSTQTMS